MIIDHSNLIGITIDPSPSSSKGSTNFSIAPMGRVVYRIRFEIESQLGSAFGANTNYHLSTLATKNGFARIYPLPDA
jgi:hypothetical protein